MRSRQLALILSAMTSVSFMLVARCATTGRTQVEMSPERIASGLRIPVERVELENGLDVVMHVDRSDPVVAVGILYHVGSARETPGKTGLAHLFEHIMFQESENVGQDELFRKIEGVGGELNGFTWEDGTMYYEVVPKNSLELVLWLESDRMGFLLGALTEEAFFNQQMVVMNEERQYVNNAPYGWADWVRDVNLYPKGHPYSWQVFGSLRDLANASLEDAQAFFKRWYGPNNATLVIAGDINPAQTLEWVRKYFGEIPAGPEVAPNKPLCVVLEESRNVYYEDAFASAPMLMITWPGAPQFSDDEAPLDMLAQVLAEGKSAPLYRRIVKERKLASRVLAVHSSKELAGTFSIIVRADGDVPLTELLREIDAVLAEFGPGEVSRTRLARLKARFETSFYRRMEGVLGRAFHLAMYNTFWGGPDRVREDLMRYLEVEPQDVVAAFERYLKGKPRVVVSVVPAGQSARAVEGAIKVVLPNDAGVVPRPPSKKGTRGPSGKGVVRTPSSFDRSVEPPLGLAPHVVPPVPYTHTLSGGEKLLGIKRDELPLVQFAIDVPGGHMLDQPGKEGTAHLTAWLLEEGTRTMTPEELEEALELLGASVEISAGHEAIHVTGSCLARNFAATMDLVSQMLLDPRLAQEDFERLKKKALADLVIAQSDPQRVADVVFFKLLFGDGPAGSPVKGTVTSVSGLTLEDVMKFYEASFAPGRAVFSVAGALSRAEVVPVLERVSKRWGEIPFAVSRGRGIKVKTELAQRPEAVKGEGRGFLVAEEVKPRADSSVLYLVNIPGAAQSVIRVGGAFGPRTHRDYFSAFITNYPLGGSFNSRLNMILREEKGYTYGVHSSVEAGRTFGFFRIRTAVQTDATGESLGVVIRRLEELREGIPETELRISTGAILASFPRQLETLGDGIRVLRNIGYYGLPPDYVERRQELLRTITPEDTARIARRWFDPGKLVYLVVGDASQVVPQLQGLQFMTIKKLDKSGMPLP